MTEANRVAGREVNLRLSLEGAVESGRGAVVVVPVVNLRGRPEEPRETTYAPDPLQESQLIYGEIVERHEECDGFVRVSAWEQPVLDEGGRRAPYAGWVAQSALASLPGPFRFDVVVASLQAPLLQAPRSQASPRTVVSVGTRFERLKVEGDCTRVRLPSGGSAWVETHHLAGLEDVSRPAGLRERLVRRAETFVGIPYLWGGRSSHMPHLPFPASGVDCSGFVSLVYRANGIYLPRNADDQWAECELIPLETVEPGDLLFLSRAGDPENIRHVMMSLGGESFIEAPGSFERVRVSTFLEKCGATGETIRAAGMVVQGETLFAGRPRGVFEG